MGERHTPRSPAPTARVSVVVPTHERRALVVEAVASVLAQTTAELELVVVDDGSTDGTAEALAAIDDPRLACLRQENRGPAAARNAGIGASTAPVVAFLDSDDRWLPEHLEVVLALLDRHPEAVLASTCPGYVRDGAGSPDEARVVDGAPLAFFHDRVGFPSCVAVRRRAFDTAGGFDERLRVAEDSDLFARLSLQGPFCLLRRRTVVHGGGPAGLAARGSAVGAYLGALGLSTQGVADAVRRLPAPERARLEPAADAAVSYVRAVAALAAGNPVAARDALADACRRFPPLEREPLFAIPRLRHAGVTSGERLGALVLAARLWPTPASATARALARDALALALRSGRLRTAASVVASRPSAGPALLRLALSRLPGRPRRRR